MADIVLSKEGFGLKLYNKFPPRYREDDVGTDYALRRYLEAIADGGFSYSIDEWNGILNFADPDQATPQVLPILFKQFGLEVFNGIPEAFLRYLLPRLGTAWSKKGGLDVIEFVASSISGVKTSTIARSLENGEVDIDVRLEMDFSLSGYFPEPKQLARILSQFLPFYLGLRIIYVYVYHDHLIVLAKDNSLNDHVTQTLSESGSISYDGGGMIPAVYPSDKELNADFILNNCEMVYPEPDVLLDNLRYQLDESSSFNHHWSPLELSRVSSLPLGVHYSGVLNEPDFQGNKNLCLNEVFVEVDQHFDVIKETPAQTEADLGTSDSQKDHVVIFPSILPTLNTGLTLNSDFTTNLDNSEYGILDQVDEEERLDASIVSLETATFDSVRSSLLNCSLNTQGKVLNRTLKTNDLVDTDSYVDHTKTQCGESAEFSSEGEHTETVTIGERVYMFPMLNTGHCTLNSGLVTNYSTVEDGDVHAEDEVSSVGVTFKISEVAVFVPSVLGMLTNTTGCVLNDSGFDVPDGYDTIRCRDGTKTIAFF